jgi:hypothetical protein
MREIRAQASLVHPLENGGRRLTVPRFGIRSYSMKRWILGLVTMIALSAGATAASAQGFGGGHYGGYHGGPFGGGYGCDYGYGGYSGYGGFSPGISLYSSGYRGYNVGYGGISLNVGSPRWHDTSHYDYHPGSFQRHRNHFHYVPGHDDLHRSGHFHR